MRLFKVLESMQKIGKILLIVLSISAAGAIIYKLMKLMKPLTPAEIQAKADELNEKAFQLRREANSREEAEEIDRLRREAAELESLINPNIQVKDGRVIRYVSTRPPQRR